MLLHKSPCINSATTLQTTACVCCSTAGSTTSSPVEGPGPRQDMAGAPSPFVTVAAGGQAFQVNGRAFFIAGCNSYYLMVRAHVLPMVQAPMLTSLIPSAHVQTRAAEDSLRHEVIEILDAAAKAGLTVIRTWAFNDGEKEWNALQPRPGAVSAHPAAAGDASCEEAEAAAVAQASLTSGCSGAWTGSSHRRPSGTCGSS